MIYCNMVYKAETVIEDIEMKRIMAVLLILVMMTCTGCSDADPGEIRKDSQNQGIKTDTENEGAEPAADETEATSTVVPTSTLTPTPTVAPTPTPEPTAVPLSEYYKEWDMTNLDTSWIDPEKKLVAFTFDDGPTVHYGKLLDTLEEYGMHATFFIWGKQYNDSYKDEIERLVSLGCELGNHTWSHPYLTKLTAEEIADEIERTRALLESITGIKDYLVRPPYGSSNLTVTDTVKVPLINWSLDTADWNNGNYDRVYSTLTEKVQDGDVILMHASYGFTADAVRDAIPVLIEQGYQIVSVSELCAVRGKRLISGVSPLSSAVKKK